MIKVRDIRNSYVKGKGRYIRIMSEEEAYMLKLIDEVESIPESERIYYTEEEFWKLIEEMETEEYGEPVSAKIRKKYA